MDHPGHADCGDLLDKIHGYLEGEVEGRDARELLGHLEACDPCRAYLESVAATRGALGRLRLLEVWGDDDRDALRRCLDEVRRKVCP